MEKIELMLQNGPPDEEMPADVEQAIRLMNLFRMNESTWQDVASGRLDKAVTGMQNLSTGLLEMDEPALAKQAALEAHRIANSGQTSALGRKRIKYGTRTLIAKTIQLDSNDSR